MHDIALKDNYDMLMQCIFNDISVGKALTVLGIHQIKNSTRKRKFTDEQAKQVLELKKYNTNQEISDITGLSKIQVQNIYSRYKNVILDTDQSNPR